jgi:hypothetical protein
MLIAAFGRPVARSLHGTTKIAVNSDVRGTVGRGAAAILGLQPGPARRTGGIARVTCASVSRARASAGAREEGAGRGDR